MIEERTWDSSHVVGTIYSSDDETLTVEFKSGATWRYQGVSKRTYLMFRGSSSKGKYFLANIKGKYEEEQVQ